MLINKELNYIMRKRLMGCDVRKQNDSGMVVAVCLLVGLLFIGVFVVLKYTGNI